MGKSIVDKYAITAHGDARDVQENHSFLNFKNDGRSEQLNCQSIDELIEDCVRYHLNGQPLHIEYTPGSIKMPWFKHFIVASDETLDGIAAESDPDAEVSYSRTELIHDRVQRYLQARNEKIRDYHEITDPAALITHIYSYEKDDETYMVLVSSGLHHSFTQGMDVVKLDIVKESLPDLPLYDSSMSYWGADDGVSYLPVEELDEDSLTVIYGELLDPQSFHYLLDDRRRIDRRRLTMSLIDLIPEEFIMRDINRFKMIGEALLNADNRSVPNALHNWTERYREHMEGDRFKFPNGSMGELDMRDHLNKSKSTTSWKTLAMELRMNNPGLYSAWHRRWVKETIVTHPSDHHGVGLLLYKTLFDRYTYSPIEDRWYGYRGNIWETDHKQCSIHNEIPTTFHAALSSHIKSLNNSIQYADILSEFYEYIHKPLSQVITNVTSVPYISNIIKASRSIFADNKFAKLLDADIDVLNTPSCIIRFNQGQAPTIRKASAEDYVSKITGVSYNQYLTEESYSVSLAMGQLKKMFPDEATRNEVLKALAYLTNGGNRLKKFIVMTGPKDTGKSTFKKFLSDIFSSDDQTGYSRDVPISVIAKEPKQGSAMPELVQCDKAKIAWFTEPDDTVSLNNGTLKGISGGDAFYARGLYSNGGNIEPTFKMILQCNKIPGLKDFDRPTLERFFIIPFNTVFTLDAPEDPEEQARRRQYPLNPDFYKQNDLICEGLLWLAVQYAQKLDAEGLNHRNSVEMLDEYNKYERRNNYYASFIDTFLVKSDSESVRDRDVIKHFKEWYRREYKRIYTNSSDTILAEMSRILGPLVKINTNGIDDSSWSGWMMIQSGSDMVSF